MPKWINTDIRAKGGEIAELSFSLEAFLAEKDLFVSSKLLDEFAKKIFNENKK